MKKILVQMFSGEGWPPSFRRSLYMLTQSDHNKRSLVSTFLSYRYTDVEGSIEEVIFNRTYGPMSKTILRRRTP